MTDAQPVAPLFTDADLIHSYTRAQALADGALVDVSSVAAEYGILFPVAMTRASYITQIETGKREGTVTVLKAIATALGVDLDDLVD